MKTAAANTLHYATITRCPHLIKFFPNHSQYREANFSTSNAISTKNSFKTYALGVEATEIRLESSPMVFEETQWRRICFRFFYHFNFYFVNC